MMPIPGDALQALARRIRAMLHSERFSMELIVCSAWR
jgi:hypothetical protein